MGSLKKILVIGINTVPEVTGIGKYSGEMLQWLCKEGYEVTMVSSFPYYPYWKVQAPYTGNAYKKEVFHNGQLTIYRCPLYVPTNPTGLKRLVHEASFFLSAFLIIFRLLFKSKFDLICTVAPPFHLGFLGLFYRFFKGGEIIYHIQDLQVDAAKELKMLPQWLFGILFGLERIILRRVNHISTISDGMIKRVKMKIDKPVLFFPNWVDIDAYFPVVNRHELKPNWGFSATDKIVLYSGSIGEKQGLDTIIRIAEQLKAEVNIKFVICGTGPYKDKLLGMVKEMDLANVQFLPLQGNDVFNDFLNMADLHLVLQKGDASDLVMPSKLTTILSVGGLALITANSGTTLYDVVHKHDIGVVINPEDEDLLREAVLRCCLADYSEQRLNARKYALEYLNKDNVLNAIITKL